MPKPKRVRPTTHPIGLKVNQVMDALGIPGDYAAVAAHFGVAVTSVYGWVDKGTIAKNRYTDLAAWSGKPLAWWFDSAPSAPPAAPFSYQQDSQRPPPAVSSPAPIYTANHWPFKFAATRLKALQPSDIARIETYILGIIETREADAVAARKSAGAGK